MGWGGGGACLGLSEDIPYPYVLFSLLLHSPMRTGPFPHTIITSSYYKNSPVFPFFLSKGQTLSYNLILTYNTFLPAIPCFLPPGG
jgi:hypothetical protein